MGVAAFVRRLSAGGSHFDSEAEAYRRLKERGYTPSALVDVGAYEGHWTRTARGVFGTVPTLMVEPQAAKRQGLEQICRALPDTELVQQVLASKAGQTVTFYEMETGSSFFPERSDAPRNAVEHVTQTLDSIAPSADNIFLKIDAQGAELEVLAGGEETLSRSTLVQLEAAVAQYNEGAPTLREVLGFMEERGFVMLDLAGHSRIQGYLVQMDLLFVPRRSPLLKDFFSFP
jgi:FkbM family methyltransferase